MLRPALAFVLVVSPSGGLQDADLLTPAERAWLAEHPRIRLAPTPDYPPTEFIEAGRHRGITGDYFELIGERLGLRFEVVHLSHEQMLRGEAELMGADVVPLSARTPEREKNWLFGEPYLRYPAMILARARDELSLEDLAGARVAVCEGYAAAEHLALRHPEVTLQPVPDTSVGLRLVSTGAVDAFVSDIPVATWFMERLGITNLHIAGDTGYVYEMGISVRQDWPELAGILEKGLASIDDAEREAIYQRWVHLGEPSVLGSPRLWLLLLGGAGGVLLLWLTTLWWNRSLALQVAQRTEQLTREFETRRKVEGQVDNFFDISLEMLCICGTDGYFKRLSPEFSHKLGYTDEELRSIPFAEFVHPDDIERTHTEMACLLDNEISKGFVNRYRCKDGHYVWIEWSAVPDLEHDLIYAAARDVTERVESDERRRLMVRELDHRVKNSLATVLAISERTRRSSDSLEAYGESFGGRISALARIHESLSRRRWAGVELRELVGMAASPFGGVGSERITAAGEDVFLPTHCVQPISMALHELFTNAVKHGALGTAEGSVTIEWERVDGDDGANLHLRWAESGGAPVEPSPKLGFGATLIQSGVSYELGGRVGLAFEEGGVRCEMVIPL